METDNTFQVAVNQIALDHKLPVGDPSWRLFNSSFQNQDLTRMDLAEAIYTGHAFTTWHSDHLRRTEHFLQGQHLALDFDTEDQRSTLPVLLADKFIAKYASLVYTTLSHTPAQPKARVVFLLDRPIQQARNYTTAAAALLWVFGAADRQCKDAVRFFYGAPKCEMEYLENVLPLALVKHLIDQYQASGLRERHKQHAMISTPDQEKVAQALRKIPAWGVEYDDWLAVLMGIHAAYGESGLALAESWADGRPGEVQQKFRSFKPNGNGNGAISVAAVFGIAKRFGWEKSWTH
jgi:hypothetical protein